MVRRQYFSESYGASYLNAEVFSGILPDILPHKHIAVTVVEDFVSAVVLGGCPDSQVSQTEGIRVIVD